MSVVNRDEVLQSLAMKLRQIGRMQIGRILGSVPTTSGAYQALIDLLERCYFMRAEINGLTALLLEKKVFTHAEMQKTFENEMRLYFEACAARWPEIEFRDDGFTIKDPKALAERSRREGWPP